MSKAEILLGVAATKRKFVLGQMSEVCFYLRIEGKEDWEITCFMPYWQILRQLKYDLRNFAHGVARSAKRARVKEFVLRNGMRNNFETGKDVRCLALPASLVNEFRKVLVSRGLREVKK